MNTAGVTVITDSGHGIDLGASISAHGLANKWLFTGSFAGTPACPIQRREN